MIMQTAMHVIRLNGYNLHRAAEIIAKAQSGFRVALDAFALCHDSRLADQHLLAVYCPDACVQ